MDTLPKGPSGHAPRSPEGEAGQTSDADNAIQAAPASPALQALLDQLAELQLRRKFYISLTNKQVNAIRALTRRALGWRADDEGREKINARAARIVGSALSGKAQKPEDEAAYAALAADLAVCAAVLQPLAEARAEVEKDMRRAARKLPAYAFAKSVHGLGDLGLAVLAGEAGDLASYPKKGHLWKRLGLAPIHGQALSTWRRTGGLSADDWTAAGYSPRRRAEVYAVISEPLFRAQSVAAGPYRAIYDRRRAATDAAHPDWSKLHSHMDALRVMTKSLLRDLRNEWRRANISMPDGHYICALRAISPEAGEAGAPPCPCGDDDGQWCSLPGCPYPQDPDHPAAGEDHAHA